MAHPKEKYLYQSLLRQYLLILRNLAFRNRTKIFLCQGSTSLYSRVWIILVISNLPLFMSYFFLRTLHMIFCSHLIVRSWQLSHLLYFIFLSNTWMIHFMDFEFNQLKEVSNLFCCQILTGDLILICHPYAWSNQFILLLR